MSQEKVTRYKEQKANRKATMKKQKMAKIFRSCIVVIVVVGAIAWIGSSAVKLYQDTRPRETAEINYTSLDDYISNVGSEE